MKKVLIGCGVAIALFAGFIAVMLYYGSAEFKPLVTSIMTDVRDGKIDQVYANTSTAFQNSVSQKQFADQFRYLQAAMGDFVQAGTVTGTSRSADSAASTGEVQLGLEFDKGETTGEFKFIKENDAWKLIGFEVDVPEAMRPQPDVDALEDLARGFLDAYNDGKTAVLFEAFSPELQDVLPAAALEEQISTLLARAGKVTSSELLSNAVNEDGLHQLEFSLDFEQAPGSANFKYIWRNAEFQLMGFGLNPELEAQP